MTWQSNAILYFSTNGTSWNMITDHNRAPLDIGFERVGEANRMVDGTLRRTTVAKKRTFNISWENLPSVRNVGNALTTVDNGWAGKELEDFYNSQDDAFFIKLRKGSDRNKAGTDDSIEKVTVLITEFSKNIVKRGEQVDLWNLSMTLEEV